MKKEGSRAIPRMQIQQSEATQGYTATLAVGAAGAMYRETAKDDVFLASWSTGARNLSDVLMEAICDP